MRGGRERRFSGVEVLEFSRSFYRGLNEVES